MIIMAQFFAIGFLPLIQMDFGGLETLYELFKDVFVVLESYSSTERLKARLMVMLLY